MIKDLCFEIIGKCSNNCNFVHLILVLTKIQLYLRKFNRKALIIVLNKIKKTCKYVMSNSEYVTINYEKLNKFIENIDCNNLENWLVYNPYNLLDLDVEKIVNFLLMFEAIDYSFWGNLKWTIDSAEGDKDGSDALLYIMLKYIKEKKSVDFSKIGLDEFEKLLEGNNEIPLLKERYNTLVEISKIVNEKMEGNFYRYIKNITTDNELFDVIVSNFSSFKDERIYNGEKIYFYKLAQLLTSDILHIREKIENIKVDYSHLVGCADYKIPQTMRALGIIEYNNELANIVDSKTEIEVSSKYEVEIRASMIVVIDYIKNQLSGIKAIDINDFFFALSKHVNDIARPYHLCRNTNY